jgi:hypothetical protein
MKKRTAAAEEPRCEKCDYCKECGRSKMDDKPAVIYPQPYYVTWRTHPTAPTWTYPSTSVSGNTTQTYRLPQGVN